MHQSYNENPVVLTIPLKDFHDMGLNGKPDLATAYIQRLLYMKGYRELVQPGDLEYHIDEGRGVVEFNFKGEHREPDFA